MFLMKIYLISIFIINYVKSNDISIRSLLSIKYPLTREDAIENFKDRSDFIFDFYNPRPIDIIDGAPSGLTVRSKVNQINDFYQLIDSSFLFFLFNI